MKRIIKNCIQYLKYFKLFLSKRLKGIKSQEIVFNEEVKGEFFFYLVPEIKIEDSEYNVKIQFKINDFIDYSEFIKLISKLK